MQFTTSFIVAAFLGTAFAMPQAAPVDCPETSAIPTCGVSDTIDTQTHHVLMTF